MPIYKAQTQAHKRPLARMHALNAARAPNAVNALNVAMTVNPASHVNPAKAVADVVAAMAVHCVRTVRHAAQTLKAVRPHWAWWMVATRPAFQLRQIKDRWTPMARLRRPAMQTVNPVKNAAVTAMVASVDPVQSPAARETEVTAPAAAMAAPVAVQAVPTASAPSARMPKVTPYVLPTDALLNVAQGSGLQWVNSDSDKVAAVQAAIAAEPKAIHVPRERPPAVSIDTGPLILVETRRDLRNMTLPFEQTPPG